MIVGWFLVRAARSVIAVPDLMSSGFKTPIVTDEFSTMARSRFL